MVTVLSRIMGWFWKVNQQNQRLLKIVKQMSIENQRVGEVNAYEVRKLGGDAPKFSMYEL